MAHAIVTQAIMFRPRAERQTLLEDHARRVEADMRALGETLQYIRKKIRLYQEMRTTPKRA